MWLVYSCLAALFTGLVSIFGKLGIHKTDSTVGTAILSTVAFGFSFIMAAIVGSLPTIFKLDGRALFFMILTGIATGSALLFYYRALREGVVNQVVAIDKISIVLSLVMSFLILDEPVYTTKVIGMVFITVGTVLMVQWEKGSPADLEENGGAGADVVNQVVAIDKISIVLSLVMSFLILDEPVYTTKVIGMVFITVGTVLMVQWEKGSPADLEENGGAGADDGKKEKGYKNNLWILYALLSTVFTALIGIFSKLGISGIEANLGTAIRMGVVMIMSWIAVLLTKKPVNSESVPSKELVFVSLTGLTTGLSCMFYNMALKDGLANVVVPMDKLSILITVAFAYVMFDERLPVKSMAGLGAIVLGTLAMIP